MEADEDFFGDDGAGELGAEDEVFTGATIPSSSGPTTTASGKPYYAKRPHKKSRAGCVKCKTRKVKCSEERPRCRACVLRNETCVYPASTASSSTGRAPPRTKRAVAIASAAASAAAAAAAAASTTNLSSSSSDSSSSSAGSPPGLYHDQSRSPSPFAPMSRRALIRQSGGQDGGDGGTKEGNFVSVNFDLLQEPLFMPMRFDQTDMKLLWFYTTKGFDAFAAEAGRMREVDQILQVTVPRHAFASSFLMDCLLALSALELQTLNQPIEQSRVLMYRTRAFAGYRKAIEEARPETFPALLACSLLLVPMASQMFRDPDTPPLYILDWMVVWRGIGLIVRIIKPQMLYESGMALLFARPPINLDASTRHIPNQLLFMVSSIQPSDHDFMHIDAYYDTLKYLGSLYRELESNFGRVLNLRIVTWFTFLPRGFVELARERRPRALVIIAHYLVFMKLCKHLWWVEGIADKEIHDIKNLLDFEWFPFMRVPIAALDMDEDIELGKLLLGNRSWKPEFAYDPVRDIQPMTVFLVDDAGHSIIYDGKWVQAETGEPPVWNVDELSEKSKEMIKNDGIVGLRHLSIEGEANSPPSTDTLTEE